MRSVLLLFFLCESLLSSIFRLFQEEEVRSLMERMIQTPKEWVKIGLMRSLGPNRLPEPLIRMLTRMSLARLLDRFYVLPAHDQLSRTLEFKKSSEGFPIATDTEKIRDELFELPVSFFKLVLGKNMKFSCCYFVDKSNTLEDADNAMLQLFCERAQIKDNQTILDIGCGWGSLCFYIAKKYKNCDITGICYSTSQKDYVEEQCRELQLSNVKIISADIVHFEMEASYDRILCIEMIEMMRNFKLLLNKISKWMKKESLLFVEYVCHKQFVYTYEDFSDDEVIRACFPLIPTMIAPASLLLYFQDDVAVVDHWLVNGMHYALTSEHWLRNMDQNAAAIKTIIESTHGMESAMKVTTFWRRLFIFLAELPGYNNGEEWMVTQYLFKKK